MEEKNCIKCGTKYPSTSEYFARNKSGKDGIENTCLKCRSIQGKINYQIKKEAIAIRSMEYRKSHKEAIAKQKKIYNETHKQEINKREKIYREVNKGAIAIKGKDYQIAHKEVITQYKKDYRKAHAIHINIKNQRRRAGRMRLLSTLTLEQWRGIKKHFNNACAYCGEEKPLTQDHFYPLCKGGEYAISNIIPVCGQCNSSKSSRLFVIWYPLQTFYSKRREKKILSYLKYKNNTQQIAFA